MLKHPSPSRREISNQIPRPKQLVTLNSLHSIHLFDSPKVGKSNVSGTHPPLPADLKLALMSRQRPTVSDERTGSFHPRLHPQNRYGVA